MTADATDNSSTTPQPLKAARLHSITVPYIPVGGPRVELTLQHEPGCRVAGPWFVTVGEGAERQRVGKVFRYGVAGTAALAYKFEDDSLHDQRGRGNHHTCSSVDGTAVELYRQAVVSGRVGAVR